MLLSLNKLARPAVLGVWLCLEAASLLWPASRPAEAAEPSLRWRATGSLAAAEAHQAAAADKHSVYAIGSRVIERYDRKSGERIGVSQGKATHLNSGFFWQGRLLCAHSNYPQKPERSKIMVLDPATMRLANLHHFENAEGSLTWVVRHDACWWCNFAFYDAENDRSYLARFDDDWRELARWSYPPELISRLGRHSLSGGVWYEGMLLATDHDHEVLYRLEPPADGRVLRLVEISRPLPVKALRSIPLRMAWWELFASSVWLCLQSPRINRDR